MKRFAHRMIIKVTSKKNGGPSITEKVVDHVATTHKKQDAICSRTIWGLITYRKERTVLMVEFEI